MPYSDAEREYRNEHTHVAELPSGATIIVAHPNQSLNVDPKWLRENVGSGILPEHIKKLGDSRGRILSEDEKAALRDPSPAIDPANPKRPRG